MTNLIKELMSLKESNMVTTKVEFSCRCAAYNYPNATSDSVYDTLRKEGSFEASNAADVKKFFGDAVKDAEVFAKEHGFTVEITQLGVGINYSRDEDDWDEENEDEEDEDEEENNFPRSGSDGQDYVRGEFTLTGPKKPDQDFMYDLAMEIGGALYGQYCDDADVDEYE